MAPEGFPTPCRIGDGKFPSWGIGASHSHQETFFCTYPPDVLGSLVGVPQQLSGRWGGKREQVILVTAGSFTASSKLQVAGLSSWLLPLLLFHSPAFNWGGKVCLVVRAFLWVLLTFNSLSRTTSNLKRKRKKSTSCGALCQDGLLLSLRVQPKVSLLIIEIIFIHAS